MKKRILFYYLKTGAGHYMPAKNISEVLSEISDYEPVLIDGFDGKVSKIIKYLVEDGYRNSINKGKKGFEFSYFITKFPLIRKFILTVLNFFVKKKIMRDIYKYKPEKIVVLHFFLIKPVRKVIKLLDTNIKEIVFVTDPFSAHSIWFNEKKLQYIVSSDVVEEKAKRKGVQGVIQLPFPVRKEFDFNLSDKRREELILTYNLDSSKKTVLAVGGGEGIPQGEKIVNTIKQFNDKYNFIMVCGRNEKLYNYANKIKNQNNLQNFFVLGFTTNVDELLKLSDLVISKAGASIIFEIVHAKKPAIIIDYIWEQEKGNMEFIVENSLGIYQQKISKLYKEIDAIFEEYDKYIENYNNINIENGRVKIAEFIRDF